MRSGLFLERLRSGIHLHNNAISTRTRKSLAVQAQICRDMAYTGFLLFDHLALIKDIRKTSSPGGKALEKLSYQCRLLGLLANIFSGLYQLSYSSPRNDGVKHQGTNESGGAVLSERYACFGQRGNCVHLLNPRQGAPRAQNPAPRRHLRYLSVYFPPQILCPG